MVRPGRGVAAAVRPRGPELRHLPRPLADPAGRPALVPSGSVGHHRRRRAAHRRRGGRQLPRRRAPHPPPPRHGVVPPGAAARRRGGLRRRRRRRHGRRPSRAAVRRRADACWPRCPPRDALDVDPASPRRATAPSDRRPSRHAPADAGGPPTAAAPTTAPTTAAPATVPADRAGRHRVGRAAVGAARRARWPVPPVGHPRVLAVGDSVAYSLSSRPRRTGRALGDRRRGPRRARLHPRRPADGLPRSARPPTKEPSVCPTMVQRWPRDVERFQPDLVVLLLYGGFINGWLVDGQPLDACDPAYRAPTARSSTRRSTPSPPVGARLVVALPAYNRVYGIVAAADATVDCLAATYTDAVARHADRAAHPAPGPVRLPDRGHVRLDAGRRPTAALRRPPLPGRGGPPGQPVDPRPAGPARGVTRPARRTPSGGGRSGAPSGAPWAHHQVTKAPAGDQQHRLGDDPARHLRLAVLPVAEHDRRLHHPVAGPHEAPHELGQEGVALGAGAGRVDGPQRVGPVGPEPRRAVPDLQAAGPATCSGCPSATAARRWTGQSTVSPPGTYREPMTASAPASSRRSRSGSEAGSWEKSTSMETMAS